MEWLALMVALVTGCVMFSILVISLSKKARVERICEVVEKGLNLLEGD